MYVLNVCMIVVRYICSNICMLVMYIYVLNVCIYVVMYICSDICTRDRPC